MYNLMLYVVAVSDSYIIDSVSVDFYIFTVNLDLRLHTWYIQFYNSNSWMEIKSNYS